MTTAIYTLSLHDALPISTSDARLKMVAERASGFVYAVSRAGVTGARTDLSAEAERDRKSTCLNSSHVSISYAVFCLKKKNANRKTTPTKSSRGTRSNAVR